MKQYTRTLPEYNERVAVMRFILDVENRGEEAIDSEIKVIDGRRTAIIYCK